MLVLADETRGEGAETTASLGEAPKILSPVLNRACEQWSASFGKEAEPKIDIPDVRCEENNGLEEFVSPKRLKRETSEHSSVCTATENCLRACTDETIHGLGDEETKVEPGEVDLSLRQTSWCLRWGVEKENEEAQVKADGRAGEVRETGATSSKQTGSNGKSARRDRHRRARAAPRARRRSSWRARAGRTRGKGNIGTGRASAPEEQPAHRRALSAPLHAFRG